jgi:ComF family protein
LRLSVKEHVVYRMYRWLWAGLDWLYPPRCGGCNRQGVRWCEQCNSSTDILTSPICPICGKVQKNTHLCNECRSTPPHFDVLRSWAVYRGPLREAILRLKYKRDVALGDTLSRPMIARLQSLQWSIDMIIPVPLGVARFVERGYNQAALLARPLALATQISYIPKALMRVRETRSQVDLTANERKINMRGAFQASGEWVKGRTVLVVDDVATSGATIDACAAALLEAGAAHVYGLTLARTPLMTP